MKKNKLLIILIIIMTTVVNAQNNPSIAGQYNLGSSSPEGGSHLIVLENGNYAITYFGGMQIGKWEATQANEYRFTPNLSESKFELYGRHNKDLKDSTKIFFNGFENSQTFIQLRNTDDDAYTMQQVFNEDANCLRFPYIHFFNSIANTISVMFQNYNEKSSPIISFSNPEKYNDFVANFIEVDRHESRPFFATFKDDTLYLDDGDSKRNPFKEGDEEIEFIKSIIKKKMDNNTIYLNPFCNMFGGMDSEEEGQDIHEHHVFNKEKNAFIDTEHYVEGEEHIKSDDSFDNMSIIYVYKKLTEYTSKSMDYKVKEKPLFQVNCD